MTSTLVHSSSTSDCEAQNPLTCRIHGVAGDFIEVPAFVQDNVDRAQSLREQSADAKVALHQLATDYGVKVADIGHVTHGVGGYDLAEEQVQALVLAEAEYDEAAAEEDEEGDYRAAQAIGYVQDQVRHEFPHASAQQQFALRYLVGLRFFGVENEWYGSEDAEEAYRHLPRDLDLPAFDSLTREQLFAPLSNFSTREKLTQIDRGYFTALSGRIPTDEELEEVSNQRSKRVAGPTRDHDMDESFRLVSDLSAIS